MNEPNLLHQHFDSPPNPFSGEAPSSEALLTSIMPLIHLDKLPKNMPYTLPQGYWEKSIPYPSNHPNRHIKAWLPWLQAACILLVVGLNLLPYQYQLLKQDWPLHEYTHISPDDARWYLENEAPDITGFVWDEIIHDTPSTIDIESEAMADWNLDDVNSFF